jgi:hypothetical protein
MPAEGILLPQAIRLVAAGELPASRLTGQLNFSNRPVTSRLRLAKSRLSGVPRCWTKVENAPRLVES